MERAKVKAREFGRTLLQRATGAAESSEEEVEERNPKHRRPSWSEVVAGSPQTSKKEDNKSKAGMPMSNKLEKQDNREGTLSGMIRSPERVFTADDVAKLVEIARAQLKKERKANEGGWQEVQTRENKQYEKKYAKNLVEGYRRAPDLEIRCWQCNRAGHVSSACPRGELCFICNSPNHKRAECPTKMNVRRMDKGKMYDVGMAANFHKKHDGDHQSGRQVVDLTLNPEQGNIGETTRYQS